MVERIRILIADDSAVIRRLVANALHIDPDFEVYPAIHGRDALDQIPQVHPDLLVLDAEMPVMDGAEAVRLIRQTNSELPIIMLCKSLDANCPSTLAALAAGANDCVTWAIRIGHVGAAIEYIRNHLIPKIRHWTQPRGEPTGRFETDPHQELDLRHTAALVREMEAVGVTSPAFSPFAPAHDDLHVAEFARTQPNTR